MCKQLFLFSSNKTLTRCKSNKIHSIQSGTTTIVWQKPIGYAIGQKPLSCGCNSEEEIEATK
jgi:hypothetical protein